MGRGVAKLDRRRAPPRGSAGRSAQISRPSAGTDRDADHVRQRRHAARPDHRVVVMAEVYDLVIVGGGPCGLAASISAQRADLKTVVLEGASVVSTIVHLSLIHISEPTRLLSISYAVFC